nr:hypothetical protein [uncultured Draconibacterium sp.]
MKEFGYIAPDGNIIAGINKLLAGRQRKSDFVFPKNFCMYKNEQAWVLSAVS